MKAFGVIAVGLGLCVGGCATPIIKGSRDVEPPTTDVYVGGLYKPAGAPSRRSSSVNLREICLVSRTLDEFGVAAPKQEMVADIDLLGSRKFSASVVKLNALIAKAGLEGTLSDYYEYKIVNASSYGIPLTSARTVFGRLMKEPQCRAETASATAEGKVYQVTKAYVGDIAFTRKKGVKLSGDLSLKAVQATLSADSELRFSGKGLVFAIVEETRTGTGF